MTYPPTNPGYPMPQQPGGFGSPGPQGAPGAPGLPSTPAYPAPPAGPSQLPRLLTAGVTGLGLAAYLASFGPLLKINADIGPFGGASFTASGLSYWTIAALTAALLAAVSLLPKAKNYTAIVAVAAMLGVLLVIGQMINRPNGFSIGWALWLVLLFTGLQAVAAVTALLFESGALAAPPARPQYGQYPQYGPPAGGYFPGGQPGPHGQRPGYQAPYANYPTGGFPAVDDDAPPTPPAGIPGLTPPSAAETAPGSPQPPQGAGSGTPQS